MNKKIIIGVIAAAIVAVAVLVGISLLGGDDENVGTIEGAAAARAAFEGLPQTGATIGDPEAPIEIVEFGDAACPACKSASETTVPELIEGLVRDGQAKLTFRPVAIISNSSERGALGAEAAARQDAMWPYLELIYMNQGPETEDWLTDGVAEDLAQELGLDVAQWKSDYGSEPVASAYFENQDAFREAGANATPTFVVIGPRGTRNVEGVANLSEFEEAIAEVGPATP